VGLCPHDDSARCSCRKPQPGLLLEAARVWDIDLESSYIVGDRWRDIEAGHRAGCRAIFVDYGYAEQRPDGPFVQVRSLREAAQWILRTTRIQRTA
jgi:D-glycero-D-manno-heptose 1,7-bisphosphate phosphatase